MREISEAEAERNFLAVLDEVERGQTFVVIRAGVRVAMIIPTPGPNGAAIREADDEDSDADGDSSLRST